MMGKAGHGDLVLYAISAVGDLGAARATLTGAI